MPTRGFISSEEIEPFPEFHYINITDTYGLRNSHVIQPVILLSPIQNTIHSHVTNVHKVGAQIIDDRNCASSPYTHSKAVSSQ
jgi:hypothetical protein